MCDDDAKTFEEFKAIIEAIVFLHAMDGPNGIDNGNALIRMIRYDDMCNWWIERCPCVHVSCDVVKEKSFTIKVQAIYSVYLTTKPKLISINN